MIHAGKERGGAPSDLSQEFRTIASAAEATRLALPGAIEAFHMSGPRVPSIERPVDVWFLTETTPDDHESLEGLIAREFEASLGRDHKALAKLMVIHIDSIKEHNVSECIGSAMSRPPNEPPHNGSVQQTGGRGEGEAAGK